MGVVVASRSFSRSAPLRETLCRRYADVRFNDTNRTLTGDALIEFLRGYEKAIIALERIDDRVFDALPELRLVSKYGVGLDSIDIEAARRRGVAVRWTAGVNHQAVAELAVTLMLALRRGMLPLVRETTGGVWRSAAGRQLSSATVGVLGCGNVGKRVAQICRAFGSTVIACDLRRYDDFYRATGVTPVPFDELLRSADVLSVHVPLDATTRHMIGAREIALMRAGAVLVNTARGGVVDEQALKRALVSGALSGAACDVFETEPPEDRELLGLPNLIATPHIGGTTDEAILLMGQAAIDGLDDPSREVALTR
jgi:phosphoglycerate dehydrogenase-like enzyme